MIQALAFYLFAAVTLASALMVITARNPVHSVFFLILAFFSSAGLFILLGAEFLALLLVVVYVGAVAVLFLFVVMMLDIPIPSLKNWFVPKMKEFGTAFAMLGGYILVFLTVFYLFIATLSYGMAKGIGIAIIDPTGFILKPFTEIIRVLTVAPQFGILGMIWLLLLFSGGFLLARYSAEHTVRSSFLICCNIFLVQSPLGLIIVGLLIGEIYIVISAWGEMEIAKDMALLPMQPVAVLPNTQVLGQVLYTDYLYIFQTAGLILLVAMIGAIILTYRKRTNVKRQDISEQINRHKADEIELKKVAVGKGLSQ